MSEAFPFPPLLTRLTNLFPTGTFITSKYNKHAQNHTLKRVISVLFVIFVLGVLIGFNRSSSSGDDDNSSIVMGINGHLKHGNKNVRLPGGFNGHVHNVQNYAIEDELPVKAVVASEVKPIPEVKVAEPVVAKPPPLPPPPPPQPKTKAKAKPLLAKKSQFDRSTPPTPEATAQTTLRASTLKSSMQQTWSYYKELAWGYDELKPTSGVGVNKWGGIGVMILDCLDTLFLFGMHDEFWEGVHWVEWGYNPNASAEVNEGKKKAGVSPLNFHGERGTVSLFETTIRALGGLISSYELCLLLPPPPSSPQRKIKESCAILLAKAVELADGMLPAFSTTTGLPVSHVKLYRGGGQGQATTLAEVGTLQLEFGKLSMLTSNTVYKEKANKFYEWMLKLWNSKGGGDGIMYGNDVNVNSGSNGGVVSWGASGDSAYEYLLKVWILNGHVDDDLIKMYRSAVHGLESKLIKSTPNGIRFVSDGHNSGKMEHLACFVPGLLALGVVHDHDGTLSSNDKARQVELAEDLAEACWAMYERTETGLSAENVYFVTGSAKTNFVTGFAKTNANTDKKVEWKKGDVNSDYKPIASTKWNILRPETLESLYILYTLTLDTKYRDRSYAIFEAFEKNSKAKYGYGAHPDVFNGKAKCCNGNDDKMETFFVAESMKYLYLIQTHQASAGGKGWIGGIGKNEGWVLNTEAHPFRVVDGVKKE